MSAMPDLDYRFLESSPLFVGLAEVEMEQLVEIGSQRAVAPGETIFTEGSMGNSLVLLYSGAIEVVTRDPAGNEVQLARLDERGAFLGEMSLVDPGPRSATVRSLTQSTILEFSLKQLEAFFARFAAAQVVILRNIARVLARRLRQANVRVAAAPCG